MNSKIKSDSIAFKLAVAFVVSMALQSMLMAVILICGGVITQSKENAYQIFSEKVKNRTDNIEGDMKNVWTNFDHYTDQICQYFTEQNGDSGTGHKTVDERLEDMAPVVMEALYYTKTTGAFLILDEDITDENSHAALYFKNANPSLNAGKDSNIYLLAGPWSVSEKTGVVTDSEWNYRLKLDESNRDFYGKPFNAIGLSEDKRLLGYWSPPFKVTPGGEKVITYSVPLTDKRGKAIGVFGVEISVEYLYKFLPISDLQAKDSYGYIIGISQEEDGPINATVTHGALQKRMLETGKPLNLELKDESNQIYRLINHKSGNEVYACMNAMGMYYNNTPFAGEEWYMIGLMEEPSLLSYTDRIKNILTMSFLLSLVVGSILAVIISRWFTKYSRLIELSEVPVGVFEISRRNGRVHMTNQVPRLLGLTKEQERQFCKGTRSFSGFLEEFCRIKTDEVNVYRTGSAGQRRWIRITPKNEEETVTGIVEDVTDEILQKKALKRERDYDGLTGVKNRRAFKQLSKEWNEHPAPETALCIVMFDLNGLKEVNDLFGHDKGDEYICFAADTIQAAFAGSQIFRIGGDEFVSVFFDVTPEEIEQCGAALEAVMEECRGKSVFEAGGVAWGYAFYDPQQDESFEKILNRADMNMYENKRKMKKIIR